MPKTQKTSAPKPSAPKQPGATPAKIKKPLDAKRIAALVIGAFIFVAIVSGAIYCLANSDDSSILDGTSDVTTAGTYSYSGTLDSPIHIDAGSSATVKIILDNVTINSSNGPAIYSEKNSNIEIELKGDSYLFLIHNYPSFQE